MKTIKKIFKSIYIFLKNLDHIITYIIYFWPAMTLLIIALMPNPDIWLAFYLIFIPIGITIIMDFITKVILKKINKTLKEIDENDKSN